MQVERLHQVAGQVQDLDEAERFYRDVLGARFLARYDPPGLLFFDFSGLRLLLEKGASKATLYLWVDDIDAAYDELTGKGVTFSGPPHLIFPDPDGLFGPTGEEEWMAFFEDPSGNTLALASRKKTSQSHV